VSGVTTVPRTHSHQSNRLKVFFETIRIHQWVKNLLLFIPLTMAHHVGDVPSLLKTTIGFFCFSFCASSAYILNDILDREADRAHPTKRLRPLAARDLEVHKGLFLVLLLLLLGFGVAFTLSHYFLTVLALYYVTTLGYSLYFKRVALLDVSVLAVLYTVRLFAGGTLSGVVISQWLLAFSMFLFFSLSLLKRTSELYNGRMCNQVQAFGRGYLVSDRQQLAIFGTASGYCSVLVFALYVNSPAVLSLYSHPARLWLVCPVICYGISRLWLLAHRGKMNEDPVVFAIKDKTSYLLGMLIAIFFLSAV